MRSIVLFESGMNYMYIRCVSECSQRLLTQSAWWSSRGVSPAQLRSSQTPGRCCGRNSSESYKENPRAEALTFCLSLPESFIFLLLCRFQMFLEGLKVNKVALWQDWQKLRDSGGGPSESLYGKHCVVSFGKDSSYRKLCEVTHFYGAREISTLSPIRLPFTALLVITNTFRAHPRCQAWF